MEKRISKLSAKGLTLALNAVLRTEANSASCMLLYQPKAPKELSKFRRKK